MKKILLTSLGIIGIGILLIWQLPVKANSAQSQEWNTVVLLPGVKSETVEALKEFLQGRFGEYGYQFIDHSNEEAAGFEFRFPYQGFFKDRKMDKEINAVIDSHENSPT